ncbi:MAG TPA: hypothetical protein VFA66_02145 [Gaiellaceae bacterium]|nr:hypothetical protein [Gaiellaceae bacterium]
MREKAAVEHQPADRPSSTVSLPSGSTEAYFRRDGVAGRLVVVYHIQKTAGTSLRRFVRTNLPPSELEPCADLQKLRYRPDELLRWHRDWYRSLAPERRAALCCVMSHSAGYLLPALDRPAEALVLIREPVDRVLSFYFYKRRRPKEPEGSRRTEDFFPLERIYATTAAERARLVRPARLESWDQFHNWQSRSLLSIHHDVSALEYSRGPTADADLWRARLRELLENVFYAGVQDRFVEYVESVARRFGWDVVAPASKVNERRPAVAEISRELRETIEAYNWLDVELHRLCRELQVRREAEGAA